MSFAHQTPVSLLPV